MLVICLHVISLKLHNNYFCASYIFCLISVQLEHTFLAFHFSASKQSFVAIFRGWVLKIQKERAKEIVAYHKPRPPPPPPKKEIQQKKGDVNMPPIFSYYGFSSQTLTLHHRLLECRKGLL